MKIYSAEKFNKKLNYLNEKTKQDIFKFVTLIESLNPQKVEDIPSIHKISGRVDLYVYRIGSYRLFLTSEKDKSGNAAIVLLDIIQHGYNPLKITNRNPKINSSINPKINGRINPKINGSINPKINGSINPKINGSINPKINGSINPKINPSFEGYYLYDLNLEITEFIILAPRGMLLFYDFDLKHTKFAIPHKKNGYVVFNEKNEWLAHMESDGKNGFNLFDISNQWIGFIK